MAIRIMNRQPELRGDLLNPIEEELNNGGETPDGAPIIHKEERVSAERYTDWDVVWDKFQGVDDEERSRLILTAVENVFGKEEALRITIAMGLTPTEAENIGIPLS